MDVNNGNFNPPVQDLSRIQTLALGVGVVGMIALIAGAFLTDNVGSVLRSYLLGYVYWAGIGIGCVGLLTLQHLTGGSWGVVIRRILEAGAKTWWLLLILFIPILAFAPRLYEWAAYQAEGHGGDKILDHKAPYLNVPFFGIRTLIYFAIWGGITWFLTKKSRQQDETGEWTISVQINRFSGPALIAFVLAVTFASVDWCMSLDPHWYSTIYGLLFVIGWVLACLAFVIALSFWLSTREPMNRVLGAPHFHDLGKLMLALVMVWTYFNLSQLIIIYSGNLPEETPWYLRRMSGGWEIVGLLLIFFHFAFPFLLLLSRDLKRHARWLALVAIFVMVMRAIDLFYLIIPNPMPGQHEAGHAGEHFTIHWTDFAALLGIGGLWLFFFIWQLKKRPLMPVNDPFFENTIAHGIEHH
ncbi:MAG TPA: hypothetical protein VF571_01870 [Pyrinomonadaceae bacterium]|jgi:hypothetical protein